MPTKCQPGQHPEVTKQERHTLATRWEPEEHEVRYIYTECGAILEASDLDEETIIHE